MLSRQEPEPDVVVVGTGPCAAAALLALSTQGLSVVVLESGTSTPGGLVLRANGRSLVRLGRKIGNQQSYTSPQTPKSLWYHELGLGGLSNHWTGAVPRYSEADFRDGERLDEKFRWPIGYDDVAPYYSKIEQILGVTGSRTDLESLPAPAHPHPGSLPRAWQRVSGAAAGRNRILLPVPLTTGLRWGVKPGGTAFNSYTDVIRPMQRSGKIRLRTGAHVLRFEHDASGRVNRVIYYDRATQRESSIACKAIVLAAGTIASTKILLDSTSSMFPDGLGNHNGLLGCFLHDHVHDMCVIDLGASLPRLGHPAYLPRRSYADSPPLVASGSVIGGRVSRMDRLLTAVPSSTQRFGAIIFGTMLPEERNRVLQASALDEFGLPQAEIRLRYRDEDKRTTQLAKTDLMEIFCDAGLAPKMHWSLEEPIPGSSVHFGGTIRMHDSPQYGLTDRWGRLYSVSNVVVADASIFTTCVEKNPTLTAMALAYRAASQLSADMKAGRIESKVMA